MVGIPKSTRSGGPKTQAGKVTSSHNSLKTGAYSSMVVIPGESEEDFRALHEEFITNFKPNDIAESAMVHDLAVLTWKKLRLERLEQAAFVRALKIPIMAIDICSMVPVEECHDWMIRDINIVTDAFIAQCKEDLEFLKPGSEHLELIEEVFLLFSRYPELDAAIKKVLPPETADFMPKEFLGHKLDNEAYKDKLFKKDKLSNKFTVEDARQMLTQVQWVAEHLDQIKTAIASVKEKRLLDLMQNQGIMRAHDDLSRSFYRTLSELRRQQTWRQQMGTVDVTPVQLKE